MVALKLVCGVMMLICGCFIYLFFRSKSLNIYKWCSALGLSMVIDTVRHSVYDWNISEFVRYSLPDGLYCASYILIMDAIWYKKNSIAKSLIISIIPIFTTSSEILQYWGLVKGTFDLYDLLCYLIPPSIYLMMNKISKYFIHRNKKTITI